MKNDTAASDQNSRPVSQDNLSELPRAIFRHWKFVFITVSTVFVLSIILSLMLPEIYKATARILPPQENDRGFVSLLTGADNPLNSLANELAGGQTPSTLYVGIMKSRSVADVLIEKFNLKELYKSTYIEDVYSTLAERSTIEISKQDQIIKVSVEDRDPQRAAAIANAYIKSLDKINRRLNVTQSQRKRMFLEDRLKEVRNDLEEAEISLRTFQEKYHLVSIEEQAKASIEGAAEIKGQIIAAQTELQVLKQFGTDKQIEAVMLQTKINELQKQLDVIEQGNPSKHAQSVPFEDQGKSSFYIPFGDLPRLGLELMRLTREAKIQENLFELLTTQYEMAKIEEAKDVETIQVLDWAVAPEKKHKPKRRAIVLSSVMISTLLSFMAAFLFDNAASLKRKFFRR